mgnify:CR=1 FL=1
MLDADSAAMCDDAPSPPRTVIEPTLSKPRANSVIMGTSEYGEGFTHSNKEHPFILAGKAGGRLDVNNHVRDEGGNMARSPDGAVDNIDSLRILTTYHHPLSKSFVVTGDTSAAAAQAEPILAKAYDAVGFLRPI